LVLWRRVNLCSDDELRGADLLIPDYIRIQTGAATSVGDKLTYTITAMNNGAANLTNVVVSDKAIVRATVLARGTMRGPCQ
jgi:hypothetical protein